MLLLTSYERSERVQKAMLCRGFKNKFWMLHHFRLRRADVVSLAAITGYSLALVLVQWTTA
jgi:cobalt/nickel transport system permease protein